MGSICIWDLESFELVKEVFIGNRWPVDFVAYDGRRVVSFCYGDHMIKIWNALTGECLHAVQPTCKEVDSLKVRFYGNSMSHIGSH